MQERICLNANTIGKFKTEVINGREHLVSKMRPIEGDSVMNGLLYPLTEVAKSYPQLNNILAPAGHPTVNGQQVGISDNPLAINAFNVGAFVRNPVLSGAEVMADLVVDVKVANSTKAGEKLINSIKTGHRLGVSTGLLAVVANKKGGRGSTKYHGVVSDIKFDHVAVLMNEAPAGENTYTLNKKRGNLMESLELDLSALALPDRQTLAAMSATEIINGLKAKPSIDDATKIINAEGLFINAAKENDVNEFLANKEEFSAYRKSLTNARDEKVDFILKNSKHWTKDQLISFDDEQIQSLVNSVTPANKYINTDGTPASEDLVLINADELSAQLKKEA